MKLRTICLIFSAYLLLILLAGCGPGVAYSPEQAAIRSLSLQNGPNAVVDVNSIKVRQTVKLDRSAFVFLSYSQKDGAQKMDCTMVHITNQNGIGMWGSSGSGAGCTFIEEGQAQQPEGVEFGSGTNGGGGGPADPAFSYAYGRVNQGEITRVAVTWEDGQKQEVNIINNSYLAVRAGEVHATQVVGLNADGDMVTTSGEMPPPTAP